MAKRPPAPPRRRADPKASPAPATDTPVVLSDRVLLALTLAAAAGYALFSSASDGFYQHDEAGHFVGMRGFWADPSSALGNWAKPGYKVLYAPFALLGATAVVVLNALVAAGCAFAAVKVAQRLGVRTPAFAFVLLALQPLWVELAFRNYAELPTALLLVLAVWAHHAGRVTVAALLLSYAATMRQELALVALPYAVWLGLNRKWTAVVALGVFPLAVNVWGWAATGDPLHLLHTTLGTGQAIADAYPRQGFWHYPSTALVIFGAPALMALLVYVWQGARERGAWHPFVLVPLGVYTAAHVAFQIQTVPIGPATGGNLRYLTVVAPLMAVLGAVGLDRLGPDRRRVLWALGPFVLVAALFLTHADNRVMLLPERSLVPLLTVTLALAAIVLARTARARLAAVGAVAVVTALLTVRPAHRTPEDALMADVAAWARSVGLDGRPWLVSHTLFHYFNDRAPSSYARAAKPVTNATLGAAAPGTYVVWDSHYSYRPNLRPDDVFYEQLLADSARYRLVREPFVTPDQGFGVFVFEKR